MSARAFGKHLVIGLGMLGLAAGLLGAAPEGALGTHGEDDDVDNEPVYSACVGAATESFGFEDTVGTFAEEAINCIAHYEVTQGRSPTVYAPGESVLRWQMALFIARAAGPAGIVLESPAQDQGFTDIGGVSSSARDAINGLAKAGIMAGTSATTFSPDASVTRGSMAVLLDALVREARPGAGAFGEDADEFSDVKWDNPNVFNDVNTVSLSTYNAIGRIYELGITKGVGDHQYGPGRLVTRAQMAVFITRALAHTVARPAGVSIQAAKDGLKGTGDSAELLISVRDAGFEPVVDAPVDIFRATADEDAFRDDGTCAADNVTSLMGSGKCRIDVGDEQTDLSGDITALSLDGVTADTTVWAWTGDIGDSYDSDDTASGQVTVGYSKSANGLLVTDNLAEGQTKLGFGETVAVTIQVVDEDDEAVPESGHRLIVAQEVTIGADFTTSSGTRSTDGDGKIVLEFTQTDPDAEVGDSASVQLTLSNPPAELPLRDEDGETFRAKTYAWADEDPEPTHLVLEQRFDSTVASDEGPGATASVTATLTDQFGDPIRGETIYFWSDDPVGLGEQGEDSYLPWLRNVLEGEARGFHTRAHYTILHNLIGEARYKRTTNRAGQATLSYSRDSDTAVIETMRARLIRGEDDLVTVNRDDPADLLSEKLSFYWARELNNKESASGRILVKEADARQVVFADEDGRVRRLTYDDNDQFRVDGTPQMMADFEKFLGETAAHINVTYYSEAPGKVSSIGAQSEWPQVDLSAIPIPEATGRTFSNINNGLVHYAADGDTIVVGSYYENDYAGAVYVYDGVDDATPTKLTPPAPQPNTFTEGYASTPWWNKPWSLNLATSGGWFGWAVDIRGDTLVVGEPGRHGSRIINKAGSSPQNGPATDGAVYVYVRNDSGDWNLDATLTVAGSTLRGGYIALNNNAAQGFELGRAVAVSKDETYVAASASRYFTNHKRMSGVFLFERPDQSSRDVAADGMWDDDDGAASPRLEPANNYVNDNQNRWHQHLAQDRELAISEDGSTVVVGANLFNRVIDGVRYDWVGGAFIFTEPDAGWATQAYDPDSTLYSPTSYAADKLGRTVAVSADGSTVAVAAGSRPNILRRGKVLVWELPDQAGRPANDDWPNETSTPTAVLQGPEHPDAPAGCLPAAGPVLGCNIGEVFGEWMDISDDGDRILAARTFRTEGDLRGSVHLFTKPAGGWSAVTADAPASSVEFLGVEPKSALGWRNHFDQSTGKIYAADADPNAGNAIRIYRITPQ